MKFKLLHVRPHVWFFKQKESISKAASDDSSSEGPYVYKRSTSLKLIKSDPSLDSAKRIGNPLDVSKPSSNVAQRPLNQKKDVRVCTVVDAGCTCRATVTSQHKQKKGVSVLEPNGKGDSSKLHDMCRPRCVPVSEARDEIGIKHDVCRPRRGQLNPKRANAPDASAPVSVSNSVVSRLVCQSSQDVVKHSQLNVEGFDVVCTSFHDESKRFDACALYGGDVVAGLDVHHLECTLRDAGFEERRRSSKKKNKYYEEGPSISSGISSSNSTTTNTDSLITGTTTEMQDMLLSANPAFDPDETSMGNNNMLSLEELKASIAQRKLASHNIQAARFKKDAAAADAVRENVVPVCSPSSLGPANIKGACRVSPPCVQNLVGSAFEEASVKHGDVGVSKKLCFSECNDPSSKGLIKQSQKASSGAHTEAVQGDAKLPRKGASRRIEASVQRRLDAQHEVRKSSVNRIGLAKGEVHETPREALEAQKKSQESDSEFDLGFIIRGGSIRAGADDDIGQEEKQVVSSSSCEIQVLSDYSYDGRHTDGNHTYPMIRMHVNGTSSSGMGSHGQGAARALQATTGTAPLSMPALTTGSHGQGAVHSLQPSSPGQELMSSDSAVAMVKTSYDPKRDFKESMLEMVVAKRLRTPRQLQQLLQCYLSLNPSHYHPTIIKVFHELCSELFN